MIIEHCKEPLVTVFMAVYNGESYIADSIDSVLKQNFRDFELLIIDDGSTDGTLKIVKGFKDPRIRLLSNEHNQGLFYTRNKGIAESRGNYFATLDCDDIAHPDRLKRQVDFLNTHYDYVLCGGRGKIINQESKIIGAINAPIGSSDFLKAMCLFSNPFINSATMIRKEVLQNMTFRPNYEPAEDYDLFQRITQQYKTVNLNLDLVYYRMHEFNISENKRENRILAEYQIIKRQLEQLGVYTCEENLNLHYRFINRQFARDRNTMKSYEDWLLYLDHLNTKNSCYPVAEFRKALFCQWDIVSSAYKGRYALLKNPFAPVIRLQEISFIVNVFLHKVTKAKLLFKHGSF